MIFLKGKSFSLNMIAMASPKANVDSTLNVGKIKFHVMICTTLVNVSLSSSPTL